MFGLGIWEIAVVLVVGLLVLGPEKLPKVARRLGKGVRELRKAATEFQRSINTEVAHMEEEVGEASGLSEIKDIAASAKRAKQEITTSKALGLVSAMESAPKPPSEPEPQPTTSEGEGSPPGDKGDAS